MVYITYLNGDLGDGADGLWHFFTQITIYWYTIDIDIPPSYTNLVGGFNHLEKYESQWEGLLWKIIQIFETTNQIGT